MGYTKMPVGTAELTNGAKGLAYILKFEDWRYN